MNAVTTYLGHGSDQAASGQTRCLSFAARWSLGISQNDFLADILEGDRWLAWAAGNVTLRV